MGSCCPALWPVGSATFKAEFLPDRSTTSPLESSRRILGGITDPSRVGALGRYRSPPSAQAMASSTEVLPCPLFPPITVRPALVGTVLGLAAQGLELADCISSAHHYHTPIDKP